MYKFLLEDTRRILLTRHKLDNMKTNKDGRYFTYCLQLQDNYYYVGSTDNIYRRLYEHFTQDKGSSIWVKEHGPVERVLEICYDCNKELETEKTLFYMNLFGFEKVRGGGYCKSSYLKIPQVIKDYKPCNFITSNLSREEIDDIVKSVKDLINLDIINEYNHQET